MRQLYNSSSVVVSSASTIQLDFLEDITIVYPL